MSFWVYSREFHSIIEEIKELENTNIFLHEIDYCDNLCDEYENGYENGYNKGYEDGYYNNKYDENDYDPDGYDEGYCEGKEERMQKYIEKEKNKNIRYSEKMLNDRYTEKWIIEKDAIDIYFKESKCKEEFRNKIYTNLDFINWCNKYSIENNDIKLKKSKYSYYIPILLPGNSWWNWKCGNISDTKSKDPNKHKFLNGSLHYIKQLYDVQAQPKSKKKFK